MKLHELLRQVRDIIPIIIFDMNGVEIVNAEYKDAIPTSLYDESIFDIGAGLFTPACGGTPRSALYITLSK